MGKTPAPSKTRPKQPVRVNPVKSLAQDIQSGTKQLIEGGKAVGRSVSGGVQKIKRFTNG